MYQNELEQLENDINCEEDSRMEQIISELDNMSVNDEDDETECHFYRIYDENEDIDENCWVL